MKNIHDRKKYIHNFLGYLKITKIILFFLSFSNDNLAQRASVVIFVKLANKYTYIALINKCITISPNSYSVGSLCFTIMFISFSFSNEQLLDQKNCSINYACNHFQ